MIADDEELQALAEELLTILEGIIRTSCAAETVNSILKSYLRVRQRSHKRQGQSPFQLAGIKVYTPDGRETNDWMEALGYPAAA